MVVFLAIDVAAAPKRDGGTAIRRWALVVAAWAGVALAGCCLPAGAQPGGAIASAPINPEIFREGEVRRLTGRFGAWNVVCDEIASLKRRYCSLRAELAGESARGALTISTGDDGRPAAMLRLPHGIILSRPVMLNFGTGAAVLHRRQLRAVNCDRAGCHFVWTFAPAELAHLRSGHRLSVLYTRWRPQPGITGVLSDSSGHPAVSVVVSGQGFAEAIQAALK